VSSPPAGVLAVDGGNSKVAVALVARDGTLLGTARGPTISHQQVATPEAMARLARSVRKAAASAGLDPTTRPIAEAGLFCLAGADLPSDVHLLHSALQATGLTRTTTVLNDTYAGLRAGSDRGWGVIVVCGTGVNCLGRAPDGRVAGFPALGSIAGDWGGGGDVGRAALAAALRGRDGRGPRTILERRVPAHFGLARPLSVTMALYAGRIEQSTLRELSPTVFAAAAEGDEVARAIIDKLADELAAMANAIIRRLHLTRTDLDVVLAGGVFRSNDARLLDRLGDLVHRVAPAARLIPLRAPPLLGAALLGLEELADGRRPVAERRLRAAFGTEPTRTRRRRPSA
jgi:N-acetylglucosamine kinase-like BadF-type ATPase